ncbi:MAG: TIGR04551 family protein [Myxococcales bacterium]|nr:TIGR04551 family protein [Myxococcales bacterium]
MRPWISGVWLLGCLSSPAWAQPVGSTTSTPTLDVEALEARIRESLREELKREIKEELATESAVATPVPDDTWAEEEWKWEEPVEPRLNFLEFDGYFRVRWDLFNNLDLGTYRVRNGFLRNGEGGNDDIIEPIEIYGPFAEPWVFEQEFGGSFEDLPTGSEAPPVPMCPTDDVEGGCAPTGEDIDTLASANMRLRLEPTLNVYEDIKVKAQIDVLDNVVLGSNPDSFPFNPVSPLAAFTRTAVSPSDGINDVFTDAIRVQRLWGEVTTPLGQLRFGRQPNHFGMGILHNEGRGLDADFGDNVDRISFTSKLGDFYIMPAYDWLVSGPTTGTRFSPFGQELDRGERDDVERWNLIVIKKDSDEVIAQRLQNDRVAWQAGGYGSFRRQVFDVPDFYREGNIENQANENRLVVRNAEIGTGSFWAKLQWRRLTVEAEYSFVYGNIDNAALTRDPDDGFDSGSGDRIELNQHGAALRGDYRLLPNRALRLELLVALATGDQAPGWGVRPLLGFSAPNGLDRLGGIWDGNQATGASPTINNFRFNPAFMVDTILWRQLIGTVTDALIIRPGIQYNITEELGARLDVVFSNALFSESTPSQSFAALDGGGRSPDSLLGVEFDLKLFFDSEDGFHFWFEYALLAPMDGMDRLVPSDGNDEGDGLTVDGVSAEILNASVAHSLQLMFGITF